MRIKNMALSRFLTERRIDGFDGLTGRREDGLTEFLTDGRQIYKG